MLHILHFFAVSKFRKEQDTHDQPLPLPSSSATAPSPEGLLNDGATLPPAGLEDVRAEAAAAAGLSELLLLTARLLPPLPLDFKLVWDERLLPVDEEGVGGLDSCPCDCELAKVAAMLAATSVSISAVASSTPKAVICFVTLKSFSRCSASTRWAIALSLDSLGLYARLIVHEAYANTVQYSNVMMKGVNTERVEVPSQGKAFGFQGFQNEIFGFETFKFEDLEAKEANQARSHWRHFLALPCRTCHSSVSVYPTYT